MAKLRSERRAAVLVLYGRKVIHPMESNSAAPSAALTGVMCNGQGKTCRPFGYGLRTNRLGRAQGHPQFGVPGDANRQGASQGVEDLLRVVQPEQAADAQLRDGRVQSQHT